MKYFKKTLCNSIIFILGLVIATFYQAKNRVQDEYMYALKVGHTIFSQQLKPNSEEGKNLNLLLLMHMNRFVVAKQYIPDYFINEELEWFCASFNTKSDGMNGFEKVATQKVQEYTKYATSYCSYGE